MELGESLCSTWMDFFLCFFLARFRFIVFLRRALIGVDNKVKKIHLVDI